MVDIVNPDQDNLVNQDFQAELAAVNNETQANGRVSTLKVPQTLSEDNNKVIDISSSALFGENALDGQVPTLTQSFIIEKSKQDKLVEMGRVAQEMYETKKVSRTQILALESSARELIPVSEENKDEERAVIVSDYEVNMFTQEPSQVEADTAINNTQAALDRIVGELRSSAIALGEKLIATVKKDQIERNEIVNKASVVFNQAIIKFLSETDNETLEGSNVKFKRDLRWGDLMSIPLYTMKYLGTEPEDTNMVAIIRSFDGTSAADFAKDLGKFFSESFNSFNVINNFALGTNALIRNYDDSFDSIQAAKKTPNDESRCATVGSLFSAFGSERFTSFYQRLNDCISQQVTATASAIELLKGKTDINEITVLTSEIRSQQETVMACSSNMAILNHTQYLIIKFLQTF